MEIKGTSRVESAAIRRKTVTANTGGTFAVSDAPEAHAQIVTGPGPIAALDSILALQDMGDATDGRSKGSPMASNCSRFWIRCATDFWPAAFPAPLSIAWRWR